MRDPFDASTVSASMGIIALQIPPTVRLWLVYAQGRHGPAACVLLGIEGSLVFLYGYLSILTYVELIFAVVARPVRRFRRVLAAYCAASGGGMLVFSLALAGLDASDVRFNVAFAWLNAFEAVVCLALVAGNLVVFHKVIGMLEDMPTKDSDTTSRQFARKLRVTRAVFALEVFTTLPIFLLIVSFHSEYGTVPHSWTLFVLSSLLSGCSRPGWGSPPRMQ